MPFTVSPRLLHSPFLHPTGKRGAGCGNVLALQSRGRRKFARGAPEVGLFVASSLPGSATPAASGAAARCHLPQGDCRVPGARPSQSMGTPQGCSMWCHLPPAWPHGRAVPWALSDGPTWAQCLRRSQPCPCIPPGGTRRGQVGQECSGQEGPLLAWPLLPKTSPCEGTGLLSAHCWPGAGCWSQCGAGVPSWLCPAPQRWPLAGPGQALPRCPVEPPRLPRCLPRRGLPARHNRRLQLFPVFGSADAGPHQSRFPAPPDPAGFGFAIPDTSFLCQ